MQGEDTDGEQGKVGHAGRNQDVQGMPKSMQGGQGMAGMREGNRVVHVGIGLSCRGRLVMQEVTQVTVCHTRESCHAEEEA